MFTARSKQFMGLFLACAFLLGLLAHGAAAQGDKKVDEGDPKQPKQEFKPVTINDQLNDKDGFDKVRTTSYAKTHTLKMVPGRKYIIRMDSTDFDAYLRLEDSQGKELAQDDDSGGNLNAKIEFVAPKADDYRIIATTFGGGTTGKYTLTVTSADDKGMEIKVGTNINAKLDNTDKFDTVRQGCYAKIYTVNLVAGKNYQFDMTSNQMDSYLRLENPKGTEVASDDDSGGNLNARMTYTPTESGTFRIIATTFGGGASGDFNLAVKEQ